MQDNTQNARLARENPAFPDHIVGEVTISSAIDVRAAVSMAEQVQHSWCCRSVEDRCGELRLAIDDLDDVVREQMATTLSRETGKPITAARGELASALRLMRHLTERATEVLASQVLDDERGRLVVNKIPYGVVVGIIPWNAPLFVAALKLAPALLAGNAVVLKSSPLAPLALEQFVGALAQRLPAQLLQVLHGEAGTGEALVQHSRVRKVSFTGGGTVGRAVQAASAHLIRPVLLELGGNDAALILDMADLSPTDLQQLVMASFYAAGQICIGCKRIYVPRQQLEAFSAAFCQMADDWIRLGDPLDPEVTVGPVVSREAQKRLEQLLTSTAQDHKIQVVAVGQVIHPDVMARGYFVQPRVVLGATDEDPLVCEEQFGPIVPILAYDSIDEAIERINGSDYGLGGSVWSSNEKQAFEIASRFQSGVVFINCHGRTGLSPHLAFGGVKQSGYGRESGDWGLLEYVQLQSLFLPSDARR